MLPLCCLQVLAFTQAERSFYWCVRLIKNSPGVPGTLCTGCWIHNSWCIHDTFRYWPQVGIQNLMDEDDYRNILEFKAGWWFLKIAQVDISHIHSCSCTGWTYTTIGQADWLNVRQIVESEHFFQWSFNDHLDFENHIYWNPEDFTHQNQKSKHQSSKMRIPVAHRK